jgi:hypothetical protein
LINLLFSRALFELENDDVPNPSTPLIGKGQR